MNYIITLLFLLAITQGVLCFCQDRTIDSLVKITRGVNEDSNLVNRYNDLAWRYKIQGDFISSELYANKALVLSQKLGFQNGLAKAWGNLAIVHLDQGKYSQAAQENLNAVHLFEELGDTFRINAVYNNIGMVYSELGNIKEAVRYYYAALAVMEKQNNQSAIASIYDNLGNVYYNQDKYPEALTNYSKSLEIRLQIKDTVGLATSYSHVANVFFAQKDYENAKKNYNQVLTFQPTLGFNSSVVSAYDGLGGVFLESGLYQEALDNFYYAFQLKKVNGDTSGFPCSHIYIATIYIKTGQFIDARFHLDSALFFSEEIGSFDWLKESYKSFVELDSAQGDFKLALEHLKLYIIYKDSLITEETSENLLRMELNYDFEKKQAILNYEIERRDKNYGILLNIAITVGIFFVLFVILYFKHRKFSNELLDTQDKLDVEAQNLMERITTMHLENRNMKDAHVLNEEKFSRIEDDISSFSNDLKTNIRLIGRLIKLGDLKEIASIRTRIKKGFNELQNRVKEDHAFTRIDQNEINKAQNSIDILLQHMETLMNREPSFSSRMRVRLFTLTVFYLITLLTLTGFTLSYGWDVMSPWVGLCTAVVGLMQIIISIPVKKKEVQEKSVHLVM